MGVPSSAQTSYFEVIVKMRSRSRKTSRSKAWSTSGAGARAVRGGGPARRWRRHAGHSRSRPANSWRTSYTSPHGHATTMPADRLTTPSPPGEPDARRRACHQPGQSIPEIRRRAREARRGSRRAIEAYYVDFRELMARSAKVIRFPRRPAAPSHERGFVEVRRCDQAEAVVVRSLFESEGIPTLLQSRLAHSIYPFSVGDQGTVVILVTAGEAERRRRSLMRLFRRKTSA